MTPQRPAPPPLSTYRPSNERTPFPPRPRPGPPNGHGGNGGGGSGRPRQPQRRSGFLNALFYLFLFVLIVAGSGVAYLIINPPGDLIRQTLADQVKAKTGRDLVVSGPASLSFYPGIGVSLSGVSLSGPAGSANTLVTMQSLNVSVKAMPLLDRKIEVETLVLNQPVFDLQIDSSGRKNWDFAENPMPLRYAQATDAGLANDATDSPMPKRALAEKLAKIDSLQLNDVRIEDGTVRFTDQRSGVTQEIKALNVAVALPSLQSPLSARGDLAWKGEKTDFDATLTNALTVIEEKPAKLAFTAKNRHLTASYNGFALFKDGADIEGDVTASSASARDLADWFGNPLPPVTGFGPLAISGRIKTAGNITTFSNANFGLDGATATGTMSVTTGGVRPYVNATLKLSELDLNKYLTSAVVMVPEGASPASTAPPAAGKRSANEPEKGSDDIEKLLNDPKGSKVYGSLQRAGWSSETLNLTLLGIADGDAKLQVGKVRFQNLTIGQTDITAALKDRILRTVLGDVQLYGGRGEGAVNIDGTGKAAVIGAAFALTNISAQPFLKDASKMEWLAGNANIDLQVNAKGSSQLQLVETLNGKAKIALADGAVVGFNLPGAIRGLSQGKFSGFNTTPTEKTDFSEMSASFQIVNGVAQNQDLQLVSPLLRVTGAGAVQLPQRTVDYTVKPKLVASLEGQQGESALSGLEVPVRITGPFDKPKFEPDLKGVLSDPSKAVEAVKDIGKRLKGKNADEIVDELFGKDDGATASDKPSTKDKAKELLNKFLKKSE